MKISNSKKQLAKIISENGGWREGAESAAQCIKGEISFWHDTATKRCGEDWCGSYLGACDDIMFTGVKLPNWHQAILSRDEYFHLYPAQDADGWIEWKGGMFAPVIGSAVVDVMYANGAVGFKINGDSVVWEHKKTPRDYQKVVAYRKHAPESETVKLECAAAEPTPTIEQLAADYRAKLTIAQQAQEEADSHRCGAEAALKLLELAGADLGLVIGVCETQKQDADLNITDWQDLLVGDVVEYTDGSLEYMRGVECVVVGFDENDLRQPVKVHCDKVK